MTGSQREPAFQPKVAGATGSSEMGDDPNRTDPALHDVIAATRALVDLMRANGLTKLDVMAGSVSIRLRAPARADLPARTPVAPSPPLAETTAEPETERGHIVRAPMVGTFYAAPAPGDPPFVRVGDHVEAGQTIGIIEAMKIMNEIPADCSGVVAEILVANGQAVEYGSPLIRIEPDEATAG